MTEKLGKKLNEFTQELEIPLDTDELSKLVPWLHETLPNLANPYQHYQMPDGQGGTKGGYEGWSLTSRDGSYTDGWPGNGPRNLSYEQDVEDMSRRVRDLKVRTPACNPYVHKIIDQLEILGFKPSKGRVGVLRPGKNIRIHSDAGAQIDHLYVARVHIPLITNPDAWFATYNPPKEYIRTDLGRFCYEPGEFDSELRRKYESRIHMEFGKAYFTMVNCLHTAYNEGTTDRYHMMFVVWDTKNLTHFPFNNQYRIDD